MRPNFIKTSVALLLCSPFAASVSFATDWDGSYSAGEQCFCVGAVAPAVENTIIPSPIGGQTVAQICQRIGAGPGLQLTGNLFNYPVYADSQCGNGPLHEDITVSDSNCAGSMDGEGATSASCKPIGPKWNIKKAFSKKKITGKQKIAEQGTDAKVVVKKQAGASAKSKSSGGLMNKPVVTSISVKRTDDTKGTTRTLKATVISSASTAGRSLPKREPLDPFTGKVITIDGKRYMQAREGIPAKGGEPGSRIILDDLVFLLDDGTIKATDLHRTKSSKAKTSKKTTSNKPKKIAKQRVATVAPRKPIIAKKADRLSARPVEPVIVQQVEKADRNSVPRVLPVPVVVAPIEAGAVAGAVAGAAAGAAANPAVSAYLDVLDRASKKNQVVNPVVVAPAMVAATPKPVTDLSTVKKGDVLGNLTAAKVSSKPIEPVLIQPLDNTQSDKQTTASEITIVATDLKNTQSNTSTNQVSVLSALKLPESVHKEYDRFSYLEAMPVSYDVGGAGFVLKGSTESHSKFHYIGRIGVTNTYQEAMLGAGYYVTPSSADRITMVLQAGVEYGSFTIDDDENPAITANYSEAGLYFGAATRFVLNHRFELRGGLGYSTFFKGDLLMFGGAYWHMTPKVDLVSQFELGDNDLVGLGIRFYY